jgi:hypothetical protein
MKKLSFITVLTILLFSYALKADEKNYCKDPDANIEWEALIQEHPGDMQIHALHALRIGLCFKVDRGDISISQATVIFENMRSALINAKERDAKTDLEAYKQEMDGL